MIIMVNKTKDYEGFCNRTRQLTRAQSGYLVVILEMFMKISPFITKIFHIISLPPTIKLKNLNGAVSQYF